MTLDIPLIMLAFSNKSQRGMLRSAIEKQGYAAVEADSPAEAVEQCTTSAPSAVLLGLSGSESDAHDTVRQLHSRFSGPIIAVSGRIHKLSKASLLDAGADDLIRPSSIDELMARLRSSLRKVGNAAAPSDETSYACGDLVIVPGLRRAMLCGEPLDLTPLEFKLLAILAKHAGKVLTHKFLLNEVWGPAHVHSVNYLRVFIAGIRRKIEKDPAAPVYLATEKGIGYALTLPVVPLQNHPARDPNTAQAEAREWRFTHVRHIEATEQRQTVNR